MKTLPLLVTLLLAGIASYLSAEPRTFTSPDGRKLTAEIVRVEDELVVLRPSHGGIIRTKMTAFSEKDQSYLRNWALKKAAESGGLFEISLRRVRAKREKTETESTDVTTWPEGYEVTVENKSRMEFDNLKVSYELYHFDHKDTAPKSRDDGEQKVIEDAITIKSLAANSKTMFPTKMVTLKEYELQPGWSWVGGGGDRSLDRIESLHLKIAKGDEVIYNYTH